MASIDRCMEFLEKEGEEFFESYVKRIKKLRSKLKNLHKLEILETEHFDYSKFIISVRNVELTSQELYNLLLEKYHLQMEMKAGTYVLAMTTVGDTQEGLDRLEQALLEICLLYTSRCV